MSDTNTATKAPARGSAQKSAPGKTQPHERNSTGNRNRGRGRSRRDRRDDSASRAPELGQKIVGIRRVTRVVAGGRRFSFSVSMVVGDGNGSAGVGVGKSGDTALAIGKALAAAKQNMVKIARTEDGSIPHEVSAKYCGSYVTIMPAPNRGMVAGSSVRNVLELAGVKDVTAKINSRSKNQLNNARAAIKALQQLKIKR